MTSLRVCIFLLGVTSVCAIIFPVKSFSKEESSNLTTILNDFENWKETREQFVKYSKDYPFGWPNFDCSPPDEHEPPSSVHALAPWHISVVGALGDSLTAGRAATAKSLVGLKYEDRGISFAIGNDDPLSVRATIPSILSHFTRVTGASRDVSTDGNLLLSQFNVARSGALASDLLRQAQELVSRMKLLGEIRFEKDWKFVNLFIGSNDLCKYCENTAKHGSNQYITNVRAAILYLRANLPRAYVNVMPAFNVQIMTDTQKTYAFCRDFHSVSCPCLSRMSKADYAAIKLQTDQLLYEFHDDIYQSDSFAVAISPAVANIESLPYSGSSINVAFPALDCFHFSEMAHDLVAKLIWQGLFEPVHHRTTVKVVEEVDPRSWKCPAEDCPFLRTVENSVNCSRTSSKWPIVGWKSEPATPQKSIIPSEDELERRVNQGSDTVVFILFGVAFSALIICFTYLLVKKKKRADRQKNEHTPLLLTANLYDDVF